MPGMEQHRRSRKSCGLLAVLLLAAALPAAAELVASGAWVRQAPSPALPLAGYVALGNAGLQPLRVTGARSPQFGRIEWHTSVVEDGVARMRALEPPSIEPGQVLQLAPGGHHLMLFEPAQPLAAGDVVELLFELDDGTTVTVPAEVRRGAPGDDAHQHHHHGH